MAARSDRVVAAASGSVESVRHAPTSTGSSLPSRTSTIVPAQARGWPPPQVMRTATGRGAAEASESAARLRSARQAAKSAAITTTRRPATDRRDRRVKWAGASGTVAIRRRRRGRTKGRAGGGW
jgi:hypothetical protein